MNKLAIAGTILCVLALMFVSYQQGVIDATKRCNNTVHVDVHLNGKEGSDAIHTDSERKTGGH